MYIECKAMLAFDQEALVCNGLDTEGDILFGRVEEFKSILNDVHCLVFKTFSLAS